MSEQITFTDTEEDITVPGKARVIFDFDNVSFKFILNKTLYLDTSYLYFFI